jgi:hypothetical protein
LKRVDFHVAVELKAVPLNLLSSDTDVAKEANIDLRKRFHHEGWDVAVVDKSGKFLLLQVTKKTLLRAMYRLDISPKPFQDHSEAQKLFIMQHAMNAFLLPKCDELHIQAAWIAHQEQFSVMVDTKRQDLIFQYYGAPIAFYFAWLSFFTKSLIVPSFFGTLLIWQQYLFGDLDSQYLPMFALLLTLWSAAVSALWKHHANALSVQWRLSLFYDPSADEALMKRQRKRSAKSNRSAPLWRQVLSIGATVAVCMGLLQIALITIDLYFVSQDKAVTSYSLCALYSLVPVLAPLIFEPLLQMLSSFEGHEDLEEQRTSLTYKRFLLHFVNRHIALLYLLIFRRDLRAMRDMLLSLLVVGQVANNITELGIPLAKSFFFRSRLVSTPGSQAALSEPISEQRKGDTTPSVRSGEHKERRNRQTRLQELLSAEIQRETYHLDDDFLEMMQQFCTVAMFSAVFPLAPLFAWLNNLFEARVDLEKLRLLRRPRAVFQPSRNNDGGIGAWQHCQEAASLGAVLVNAACLTLVSSQLLHSVLAIAAAASASGSAAPASLRLMGIPLPMALVSLLLRMALALGQQPSTTSGGAHADAALESAIATARDAGEESLRLIVLFVIEHMLLLLRFLSTVSIAQAADGLSWLSSYSTSTPSAPTPPSMSELVASQRLEAHTRRCELRTAILRHKLYQLHRRESAATNASVAAGHPSAPMYATSAAPHRSEEFVKYVFATQTKKLHRVHGNVLTARQRRQLAAQEQTKLVDRFVSYQQTMHTQNGVTFAFEPSSAAGLLLAPALLQHLRCPLWLSLPLGLTYLAYHQTEKERQDRRTAMGMLADPALRGHLRDMLLHAPSVPINSAASTAGGVGTGMNTAAHHCAMAAEDRDALRWLDEVLAQLWPYLVPALEQTLLASLQPLLDQNRPFMLAQLKFTRLSLGSIPPTLLSARTLSPDIALDDADASLERSLEQPLEGRRRSQSVRVDIDLMWRAAPQISLKVMTALPPVPMTVSLDELTLAPTTLRVELLALDDAVLPCFGALGIAFVRPPALSFALKLAQLDVTKLGLVQQFSVERVLRDFIGSTLESLLVLPNKLLIPLTAAAAPQLEQLKVQQAERTDGLLHLVLIKAEDVRAANLMGDSDPYVVIKRAADDGSPLPSSTAVLYRSRTIKGTRNPVWSPSSLLSSSNGRRTNDYASGSTTAEEKVDLVVRDLENDVFELCVFDEDFVTGQDSLLGRAVLRVRDLVATSASPIHNHPNMNPNAKQNQNANPNKNLGPAAAAGETSADSSGCQRLVLPLQRPESGLLMGGLSMASGAATGMASGVTSGARGLMNLASSASVKLSSTGTKSGNVNGNVNGNTNVVENAQEASEMHSPTKASCQGSLYVVAEFVAVQKRAEPHHDSDAINCVSGEEMDSECDLNDSDANNDDDDGDDGNYNFNFNRPEIAMLCKLDERELQMLTQELQSDLVHWNAFAPHMQLHQQVDHQSADTPYMDRDTFSISSPYDQQERSPSSSSVSSPTLVSLFTQPSSNHDSNNAASASAAREGINVWGLNPMRSHRQQGNQSASSCTDQSESAVPTVQASYQSQPLSSGETSPKRPKLTKAISSRVVSGVATISAMRVKNLKPGQAQGIFRNYTHVLRPYLSVTLDLRPDSANVLVNYATAYKKNDLSPVFEESFHLVLRNAREAGANLLLIVYDKQKSRTQRVAQDIELGRFILPLMDLFELRKPTEFEHRLDVSQSPDGGLIAGAATLCFRMGWAAASKP